MGIDFLLLWHFPQYTTTGIKSISNVCCHLLKGAYPLASSTVLTPLPHPSLACCLFDTHYLAGPFSKTRSFRIGQVQGNSNNGPQSNRCPHPPPPPLLPPSYTFH